MEVQYKKDLRHNYMVMEDNAKRTTEAFCIKMLEVQNIQGIIPVEQKFIDNRTLLYYDITAKQSIINLLDKSTLSYSRVQGLCSDIIKIIETAYEYFLPEDDFILMPEFIYIDISTNTPNLCLLPGYGKCIKEQMNTLLEYLMNKVDYSDKDAVYLVYQLYAASKEEGYTLDHLKEVLQDTGKNHQAAEKTDKDEDITKQIIQDSETKEDRKITFKKNLFNQDNESKIPVVMEKIEDEKEIACYSIKTLLYAGACILGGILIIILSITSKVIFNTFGNRIDYGKLIGLLVIVLCIEGYLLNKILDRKNRITKMVRTKEYIDPREDYSHLTVNKVIRTEDIDKKDVITHLYKNQVSNRHINFSLDSDPVDNKMDIGKVRDYNEEENEEFEPTCLLNASNEKAVMIPVLKALDDAKYNDIPITSLPFFIGKLKKNVDFCLDSDTVSRYHAKITKEGEAYYLTDLNSTNGTAINQSLLQTYEKKGIQFGDEIMFADIKYRFLKG